MLGVFGIDGGNRLGANNAVGCHANGFLWDGDAIKTSHKMLDDADNSSILISKLVWDNLSESNQKNFTPQNRLSGMYVGNIVNVLMNNWLDSND